MVYFIWAIFWIAWLSDGVISYIAIKGYGLQVERNRRVKQQIAKWGLKVAFLIKIAVGL